MTTTHHQIVVRHMDDGTYRSGCVTADLDICRETREQCECDTLADMKEYGEYKDGDSHEFYFIPQDK